MKLSQIGSGNMVAIVSVRTLIKKAKVISRIILLALILLYILPKLFNLFWDTQKMDQKSPDQHLLEKPLRVELLISTKIIGS